jgi:tetratricopeptide (TPR) repeat protein
MSKVAEELNVAHVLEGSVRKDGNRVRVTAQLIEARSDTHLWSQAFETELENIFAVQRSIAANIARVLKFELLGLVEGGEAQPGAIYAANPAAYEAYLKGRELARMRALDDAIEQLKRSTRLDANFAPAQAQLGIALALAADSPAEAVLLATSHLERARELDPNLPELSGGQALLAIANEDYESAVEHARQALVLNPNYNDAMNWLSMALVKLGRWEEAETTLKRMVATDPLAPLVEYNYAALLIDLGRYEEASGRANLLMMKNPYRGSMLHKMIAFTQGRVADGLYWSLRERSAGRGPRSLDLGLLMGFTWIGEYEEARRIDPELAVWPDSASGRVQEALEILKRSEEAYSEWDYEIASVTGFVLYQSRRIREALPYLERFYRKVPQGRRQYWMFYLFPADNEMFMRLAQALRVTGDEQGAQLVADVVRRDQSSLHAVESNFSWVYRSDAMVAAFDRDRDRVVEALELAVQYGHRDVQFFDDPIFDGFREDPRFTSLRQELVAILATERAKSLQMICFNNPVPEDWQPLPETCEGVN